MGTLYVVRLHKSVIPVVRTGIDTGDMEMWQKKWEFIMLMILGGGMLVVNFKGTTKRYSSAGV